MISPADLSDIFNSAEVIQCVKKVILVSYLIFFHVGVVVLTLVVVQSPKSSFSKGHVVINIRLMGVTYLWS